MTRRNFAFLAGTVSGVFWGAKGVGVAALGLAGARSKNGAVTAGSETSLTAVLVICALIMLEMNRTVQFGLQFTAKQLKHKTEPFSLVAHFVARAIPFQHEKSRLPP
jgi:hypothetical protein